MSVFVNEHRGHTVEELMSAARNMSVWDIPLFTLGDSLLSRWWNSPRRWRTLVKEMDMMNKANACVSASSYDCLVAGSFEEMQEMFPPLPKFWNPAYFPAAVPMPMPLALYYYYHKFNNGSTAEVEWWSTIAELECALLFVSGWWHTAARGKRAVLVEEDTIRWIEYNLQDVEIDADTYNSPNDSQTAVPFICSRMREVLNAPSFNVIHFTGTSLPESYFVDCEHGTAELITRDVDGNIYPGDTFEFSKITGRYHQLHVGVDDRGVGPRLASRFRDARASDQFRRPRHFMPF